MNRRAFLKAAASGLGAAFTASVGGLALLNPSKALAEDTPASQGVPSAMFKHKTLSSGSMEPVGTRIVLVFDISGSIDATEYDVQLEAMASAIESEDFKTALYDPGGPQSIAISLVDFGTDAALRIPWLDVRKGEDYKLKALASEIRGLKRREDGGTDQISGLQMSMLALEKCPWDANKSIVNMITDGIQNSGWPSQEVKNYVEQLATQYEATTNALITLDSGARNLEEWSKENLITQPGHLKANGDVLDPGFTKIVATQQSTDNPGAIVKYQDAMRLALRRNLILEVAELNPRDIMRQEAQALELPADVQMFFDKNPTLKFR